MVWTLLPAWRTSLSLYMKSLRWTLCWRCCKAWHHIHYVHLGKEEFARRYGWNRRLFNPSCTQIPLLSYVHGDNHFDSRHYTHLWLSSHHHHSYWRWGAVQRWEQAHRPSPPCAPPQEYPCHCSTQWWCCFHWNEKHTVILSCNTKKFTWVWVMACKML